MPLSFASIFEDLVDAAGDAVKRALRRKDGRRKKRAVDYDALIAAALVAALQERAARPEASGGAANDDTAIRLHDAARFISLHSGVDAVVILRDPAERERAYKLAARELHPDAGGGEDLFKELGRHNQLLKDSIL